MTYIALVAIKCQTNSLIWVLGQEKVNIDIGQIKEISRNPHRPPFKFLGPDWFD